MIIDEATNDAAIIDPGWYGDIIKNTLEKLYDEAYAESDKMKDLVKERVPTYKIDRRA